MELTREIRDRRVAIARDVLLQMGRTDAPLKVATGNGYVVGYVGPAFTRTEQIQPHIELIQQKCEVCQRGAVLLSKARLYGGVDGATIFGPYGTGTIHAEPEGIDASLADTFDRLTLDRLEAVFEASPGTIDTYDFDEDDENAVYHAAAFGRSIPNPAERVRVCMQSLIDHDGELVLDESLLAPVATEASPL